MSSSAEIASKRWLAASTPRTMLRTWGDEWVAYVGATGNTHLLSAEAGMIVQSLRAADRPLSAVELADACGSFAATWRANLIENEFSLQDTLKEMERIGLATMHAL